MRQCKNTVATAKLVKETIMTDYRENILTVKNLCLTIISRLYASQIDFSCNTIEKQGALTQYSRLGMGLLSSVYM